MNAVKEKAFAKINLYIDVLKKRDDGFHDISTVMHSVSLCDDITVTLGAYGHKNVRLILDGNKRLPTDSKNLAVSAAENFMSRADINADITIKLHKRIPVSAGLAGGSTDAAATLRAMNKLFKRPFSDKALLSMAEQLGSDVPYCLLGGTALCSGKGEKIERLTSTLCLHTVIASTGEYISTPRAYSMLDEIYDNFEEKAIDIDTRNVVINSLKNGQLDNLKLYNIFESAVLPLCPKADMVRAKMYDMGAIQALMSGSGPSVYGIFPDEATAINAEQILIKEGVRAFYARSV